MRDWNFQTNKIATLLYGVAIDTDQSVAINQVLTIDTDHAGT